MISLYPHFIRSIGYFKLNMNLEVANKLTGILHYTSASQSVANYTSIQLSITEKLIRNNAIRNAMENEKSRKTL